MKITVSLFVTLAFAVTLTNARPIRWCVTSHAEELKCLQLRAELEKLRSGPSTPAAIKKSIPEHFECVKTYDKFVCMDMIEGDTADLITLDSGLSYFAGRQHNMMPLIAENYDKVSKLKPTYYAVAVTRATDSVSLSSLGLKKICFPGIGMSAGWIYPIGRLLRDRFIDIKQCNALVKAVTNFFSQVCLPGALSSFYNPYGNNPTSVCQLCRGQNEEFCSTSDRYGDFDGAFRCVAEGTGDLTFLRHDTIELMTNQKYNMNSSETLKLKDDFSLFCPDGTSAAVDNYEQCNWGEVSSDVVMTSAVRDPEELVIYKEFLQFLDRTFGRSGTHKQQFQLFDSKASYPVSQYVSLTRKNLMFSDMTQSFKTLSEEETYYTWVGDEFMENVQDMSTCPSPTVRWCVTSMAEKLKCEDMMMAFKAKELKPELDCLFGGNATMCMEMIQQGLADLINLDAGDVYIAGRRYGLVPIAAEDYGDMSMAFRVVAVARKTDKYTTLFNMRGKRVCQPGIGRGDGWVIPLNIFIETEQFLPDDCTIFRNIGELFVRSCIPGALDSEYNPNGKPISLCEGCAAGGFRKCQRNAEEQYYGAAGAFRCLVEKGGDIAFIRHLTARDNTDGRNHAIWARNRRSDDYELMCKDGRRLNIDRFDECHLGYVPSNAIVTASWKSPEDKEIMWNLLNYGQQFFSSDIEGDFHMFDSGLWYTDLLFTDAAVRLMKIPEEKRNYRDWLGESFIAQIENLHKYTCVSPDGAVSTVPSLSLLSALCVLVFCILNRL